jgi:hypothetical protein
MQATAFDHGNRICVQFDGVEAQTPGVDELHDGGDRDVRLEELMRSCDLRT